ncbi:MAG: glycosyltransferase family 9 protein [Bacteroidia bacterium]
MKVLIIRFSSIGDIVITTPIIRAVRQKYPEAEIDFLTKSQFSELISNNRNLNRVYSLDTDNEQETISKLKKEDFDIVIDLHKNLRTRKLKAHLKPAKWYSYKKLNIQKWLLSNFKINLMPDKHLVDRYFDGLKELDLVNDQEGLDYHFPADFSMNLQDFGLESHRFICTAIGGTYQTKQIPEDVILNVIKRLNEPIVLIGGGEADEQKSKSITQQLPANRVVNLCNKLSFHESAYVIKNANKFITGDTGMMHIASAFDTPIISIWGNTHPHFGMYAYRPKKGQIHNHIVPLKCNPCSKLGSKVCPRGHFRCMVEQDIGQIVKNCLSIESTQ